MRDFEIMQFTLRSSELDLLIHDINSSSYFLFVGIVTKGLVNLPNPLVLVTNVSVSSFSINYADIFQIIDGHSGSSIIHAVGSPGFVIKNATLRLTLASK